MSDNEQNEAYVEAVAREFVCRVYDHLGKGRLGNKTLWEHVYPKFKDEMRDIASEVARAAIAVPRPTVKVEGLASRLDTMAAEDEHWDNDDLAATHRAIAAQLRELEAAKVALQSELAEAKEALSDIASVDRAFIEAHGEMGAIDAMISRARNVGGSDARG